MQVNYWPNICRDLTRCSARFFHCSLYCPLDKNTRTNAVFSTCFISGQLTFWDVQYGYSLTVFYKGLDITWNRASQISPSSGYVCLGLWKSRNHISLWCVASIVTQWLSACWLSCSHELACFFSFLCLSFLLKAPAYSEFLSSCNLNLRLPNTVLSHLMLSFRFSYVITLFKFLRESHQIILAQPLSLPLIGHFIAAWPSA